MTDPTEKTDPAVHTVPPPQKTEPGWLRWLPALIIVAGAFAYYGSYWHYWFNPHDEGGTACLVAQRLLAGERPWVDVTPGYNIGWFLPLVGLFHFTGVNYLAARAWFFFLATLTSLLGCAAATRVSGSRWLGLSVGLLLLLLPGSQFKDYIPLSEAANTACLIFFVSAIPAPAPKWWGSVFISGLVLGLTYLVRVEIAIFFSAIWIGVFVFLLLDRRATRRIVLAIAGLAILGGGVLLPHIPVYFYCRSVGVESQFLGVYSAWFRFLAHPVIHNSLPAAKAPAPLKNTPQIPGKLPAPATDAPAVAAAPAPTTPAADAATPPSPTAPAPVPAAPVVATPTSPGSSAVESVIESTDSSTLRREPVSQIWRASGRNRILPFLTYAPFLGFAFFIVLGVVGIVRALLRREFTLASPGMQWLLLIGGSLTTFPQFFFFRPDRPHLSEFMPGYMIAMAGCVWLLWPRNAAPHIVRRIIAWAWVGFLAIHLLLFSFFAFEHPSAGTIAARKGRKARFIAENGVKVHVSKREALILTGIRDAVLQHSKPEDYLVCYPYMPGYNLMTNRRTYIHNVYVDNATRTVDWSDRTIAEFEANRPAVVIVDDRKINGADASSFSHWAAKAYAYLKHHYTRVGRFDDNKIEVFALPSPALPTPTSSTSPAQ